MAEILANDLALVGICDRALRICDDQGAHARHGCRQHFQIQGEGTSLDTVITGHQIIANTRERSIGALQLAHDVFFNDTCLPLQPLAFPRSHFAAFTGQQKPAQRKNGYQQQDKP